MSSSVFSYNVTRRYRYAWFTPTVFGGGLVFLILFSFINYASTGYRLVIQQSTDPNATVDDNQLPYWTKFVAHGLKPSCQPTTLDVGATVITTNKALIYTIMGVDKQGKGLPSLVYLNQRLDQCTVMNVTILMDLMDRNAAQMSASPWGIELRGDVNCVVQVDLGPISVKLTATWDPFAAPDRYGGSTTQFLGRNRTALASLFWGESLLSNYRIHMEDQLWSNRTHANAAWDGVTKVSWGFNSGGAEPDITNIDFCNTAYRTISVRGPNDQVGGYGYYRIDAWPEPIPDRLSAVDNPMLTPLVQAADGLVKSFNSTIMTDLGQADAKPNILTDPQLLQHFTANFTTMLQTNRTYFEQGPLRQSYEETKKNVSIQLGPLNVSESTLASSYICNIPQRKPWSELVLAILLADLVFMRTLWSVFTLSFGWWMANDDVGSNMCEGCAQKNILQPDNTRSSLDRAESDAHSQASIPLMPVAQAEI